MQHENEITHYPDGSIEYECRYVGDINIRIQYRKNGTIEYKATRKYVNGRWRYHNENGPAWEEYDDAGSLECVEFFWEGNRITHQEFLIKTSKLGKGLY